MSVLLAGPMSSLTGFRTHPGYISGGVYALSRQVAPLAIAAVDTVYLLPFMVDTHVVPASFGPRVTTGGAGSSVKIAVWANNPATMRPTGLPIMSNNTGAATTSAAATPLTVTGVTLIPGLLYWHGIKATGTLPTVQAVGVGSAEQSRFMGITLGTTATNPVVGLSVADAYANDIAALDLTSASFTNVVQNTGVCAPQMVPV